FKSKYRIQSARLRTWDYSKPGDYFITTCCANHEKYFGEVVNHEMLLNELGKIANECWNNIPIHFPNVELGEFQIMPNHIHGILIITTYTFSKRERRSLKHESIQTHFRIPGPSEDTISAMVGSFKSAVTNKIHKPDRHGVNPVAKIGATTQFGWQPR